MTQRDTSPNDMAEPVADLLPYDLAALRNPLEGETIRLVPLHAATMSEPLHRLSHGDKARESIWRYLPYGPFASREAMSDWIDDRSRDTDVIFFALQLKKSGRCVGMCSYLDLDPMMRRCELGHIWIAAAHQRSAVLTDMAHAMLRRAFDESRCRRVQWVCDSRNEASRRAALRLGFRFEGVLRNHRIVRGLNRDTAVYSMLDREWPLHRAALREWIARVDNDHAPLQAIRDQLRLTGATHQASGEDGG